MYHTPSPFPFGLYFRTLRLEHYLKTVRTVRLRIVIWIVLWITGLTLWVIFITSFDFWVMPSTKITQEVNNFHSLPLSLHWLDEGLLQAQWLSGGSSIRGCLPCYTAIPTIFTIFTSNSYCCVTFREGSQTSPSSSLQEISTKMFHQKIGQVGTDKATNLRTPLPSSLFLWRRECQRQLSEPLLLFIK